ncbi:hypothetical protein [Aureimonas sp. SK2]|uniref:hypothetical protein n=1 Tax=Aureimonas sp. SK2 TaxID=3015992 RepID=UPI002445126D|nr:hypothetical protein [Aureimonas sp. SK2]
MSGASTIADPKRVLYGAQEVAQNPGIIDFSFEAAIPFDGDRFPVRVRSTWNGIEEIRGHIARLEERALQAEAKLRHVEGERRLREKDVARLTSDLDAALSRAEAAERTAHDAHEIVCGLRADEFSCETVVPIGDVEGNGNVWVRLRSTQDGVGMLVMQLCRLDQRAVLAEAALETATARARASEARAGRSGVEWEELHAAFVEMSISRSEAVVRLNAAEARLQVAEDKFHAVEDAVRGYFDFTRSVDRLEAVTEAA